MSIKKIKVNNTEHEIQASSADKLNTNAGDSNTPVYFSNGVPVACTSLDLNTTGNAATATELQTARTIGMNGAVRAQNTSFNGSSNITIPVAALYDSYISFGGKNLNGTFSALDAALIDDLSANRLAGLPDSYYTFEQTSDAGATWTTVENSAGGFALGTNGGVATNTNTLDSMSVDNWHRITIDVHGKIYCILAKIAIYLSTEGATGCQCKVEWGSFDDTPTWTEETTADISGWAGWNIINVDQIIGSSTYGNVRYVRLTFSQTGVRSEYTSNLQVYKIRFYSHTCWLEPSTLARNGYVYTVNDDSLNTTFPAGITATKFSGTFEGSLTGGVSAEGIVTSGTGAAYTATVPGITSLKIGASFVMIPHTRSTSNNATLNVNGLGAKTIRRKVSSITGDSSQPYVFSWLAAYKPIRVMFTGTYWVADLEKPNASDLSGTVEINHGGTGASTEEEARTNLGAMADVEVSLDDVGKFLRVDSTGTWAAETVSYADSDHSHTEVTTTNPGFMSASDKSRLDALDSAISVDTINTSVAEGHNTAANGYCSHAEGYGTAAIKDYAHAEGLVTTASGDGSHAEGLVTTASGDGSHAEGCYTTALDYQHAQGHYNDTSAATAGIYSGTSSGTAFVIGNGSEGSMSNAFRVTYTGKPYSKSTLATSGCDYAEFFEWQDSNPNNEDRRGYFVTLDGDKIKIAKSTDYILGIISGQPSVVGNGDESWLGRYVFDEFGAFVYEDFEYEIEEPVEVIDEETGETRTEIKSVKKTGTKYKENPNYDPSIPYIQREDRPEWDPVGMLGVLSVRDDGTCQVNGYCKVTDSGTATTSETGYRVIKRVNDNIVKVIFR